MTRRTPVDPRPLLPPRLSLLKTAEQLQDATDRWVGGFAWQPEGCGGAGRFDLCGNEQRDIPQPRGMEEFEPYGVYAIETCSTFGWQDREWIARAGRLLDACQSSQIEAELWRGDIARAGGFPNRYLTDGNADVIDGGPADPMDALACLELAIANCICNANGWIHASRQVVSIWSRTGALRREGNLLLTALDTVVVPGGGYDGSGPPVAIAAPGGFAGNASDDFGTIPPGDYGFKVTAFNGSESAPTAELVVNVVAPADTIGLNWNPVAGATVYNVYGGPAGGPWTLQATVGGTNINIGALVAGGREAPVGAVPGPFPASDGSVWAYATSPISVRLGAIETLPGSLQEARQLAGAVARDVNDITILAQRPAAATWDNCCHVAVEINAPACAIA